MIPKMNEKIFGGRHWILKNLVLAVIAAIVVIVLANILLSVVTRHNKESVVPDFLNMTFAEAEAAANTAGLKVEVVDSVFIRQMRKGAVYFQFPAAGEVVKSGRSIELTLNGVTSKMVAMPKLIGYSISQAKAELLGKGLFVGKLIYKRDMATNNVLGQQMRGRKVEPGEMVEAGSSVDLVLGLNSYDNCTYVPNVTGLSYQYAVDALLNSSLNVRNAVFDAGINSYSDSLCAVVYKQKPGNGSDPVTMGTGVTIYLTNDESKLPSKK